MIKTEIESNYFGYYKVQCNRILTSRNGNCDKDDIRKDERFETLRAKR